MGDICTKIGSGATPKGGKESYRGGDTSLIRSQNVLDFSFSWDGLAYINKEQALKLNGVEVKQGDVLLNITGDSVARVCIVPKSALPARVNQHVSIIRGNSNIVLNDYILYFLQYKKLFLLSLSQGGATRNALTKGMIEELTISLPALSKQAEIVSILKSLDDKIEINRRINDNLEQQAQALFKSWFVDFEPFKDQPFEESELGMIPKGWRIVSLNEACIKVTDGSHYSPKDSPLEDIPMLSVKDMQHNGFDYSSCKKISEEEYKKMKANDCVPLKNDILVAKDGSYLKEIFMCLEEKKQAILSSIAIFRCNSNVVYPEILLQILRLPKIRKDVGDNYVSGTALPRIVLKDFKKYRFVLAPIEVQDKIIETFRTINAQIYKNEDESRRLAQLRDLLLPKLMSGEIKV